MEVVSDRATGERLQRELEVGVRKKRGREEVFSGVLRGEEWGG